MIREREDSVSYSDCCTTQTEDMTQVHYDRNTALPNDHEMQNGLVHSSEDRRAKLREWAELVIQIDQFEKEITDHFKGEMP